MTPLNDKNGDVKCKLDVVFQQKLERMIKSGSKNMQVTWNVIIYLINLIKIL